MPLTTQPIESLRGRVFGLKALVADFDSTSLELLSSFLKEAGMEVIVARDGLTALELFRSQNPQLVFLEAMLPKISGFEISQQIYLETQGKVPVIIITGIYKDNRHRVEAIQTYKAAAFLTKPWQRDELAKVIMDVLGPEVKPMTEEDDLALESLDEITPLLKETPSLKTSPSIPPSSSLPKEKKAKEPRPGGDEIDRLLEKTLAELGFEAKKKPPVEPKKEAPFKTPPKSELKTSSVIAEIKPKLPEIKPSPVKPTESKVLEFPLKESRPTEELINEAPTKDSTGQFFMDKEKFIDTERLPFALSPTAEKKAAEEKDQKISEPVKPPLSEVKIEEEIKAPSLQPTLFPAYFEAERPSKKRHPSLLLFGITGAMVVALLGVFVFRPKKPASATSPQISLQETTAAEVHQNLTARLEEQENQDKVVPSKSISRQKENLSGLLASLKKEEASPEEENPPILVTETKTAPLALPLTPPPIKMENQAPPPTQETANIQESTKVASKIETPSMTIKEGDLVPLDQVDIQPRPIKVVEPRYPEPAKQMGLEGVVVVNALISENGDVIRTEILRGLKNGAALEQAAQAAIRQWKFSPAVKNGVKVKVWKPIETRFRLKQ